MRKDLNPRKNSKIMEAHLDNFESTRAIPSDNPIYEDPRDVIGEKHFKPVKKRMISEMSTNSPRGNESRSLLREQKRKLTKKYENLITTLMDRCEANVIMISEKEAQVAKLKDKLRSVLEYNKQFADENDTLKQQYNTMVVYIEDCKRMIEDLETRNRSLEEKCQDMAEKVKQIDAIDKEWSSAIPLVEVCMSCSSREILLRQTKDHNTRLQRDMEAMKDVLYRLNLQLSRYQEKLRSTLNPFKESSQESAILSRSSEVYKGEQVINLDSFLGINLPSKQDLPAVESEQAHIGRVVDLSGLLSAQALAPLFNAYQESIQEKENLISDYEKQFENFNKKTKQIVADNKSLISKVDSLENEIASLRQNIKKISVEKETMEIDRATLLERTEKAELKLKEVYELYEDKMAAMMRDYETIHREYFATKSALAMAESRAANLDATLRAPRTVPADLHERRVHHCQRLLEELKHQYSMESERRSEQISKLQEQKKSLEEKYKKICEEHETVKGELTTALKNVRLYRRAAVIFRQRLRASVASMASLRRSGRRARAVNAAGKRALHKLETIKAEIKAVKARAYSSLEELERRILSQERRAARAEADYQRELERAQLVVEHKERIIRSLIDKVADVEEVRLSQSSSNRLQGILPEPTSHDDSASLSQKNREGKDGKKGAVKLVPVSGGYFQDPKRN
ncbi:Protein Cep89 homolog [Eumeta japonica]|uniref:Protein Cep89 homolog n=1 Tax=Eumeta variegata TaxID=151549 RepID=A0A4C1U4T4_EUMVA|nr:Protein Cep89 homolog [Eumeta japonica]